MVTLDGDWSNKEDFLVTETGHHFREDQHGAMGQSADSVAYLVLVLCSSYMICCRRYHLSFALKFGSPVATSNVTCRTEESEGLVCSRKNGGIKVL